MRFLVGLSGGVDSAAVALSLLEAGHEVVSVFLRLFEGADTSAAEFVAQKLGIPLEIVDAREEFSRLVIDDFVCEHARGRTPNPCALCNREIKLRLLCKAADRFGCERVATGHYASVGEENGRFFVRAAADKGRDQSYFLWRMSQEQLKRISFVLCDTQKAELGERVRLLVPPETRESREVCFIPDNDRVRFLEERLPPSARVGGEFVDGNGAFLAPCAALYRYTVGQRRGFGVGFGRRVYVKEIDVARRRVVLTDPEDCLTDSCRLSSTVSQKTLLSDGEYFVFCRERYRAPLKAATVTVSGKDVRLTLSDGARAVFAPGQSLVCYDGQENLLFGGVIEPAEG